MSTKITVNRSAGRATIRISGRLNFEMHSDFRTAIRDSLAGETPVGRVVVDLSNTEYVDSSGLGMLLLLRYEAQTRGVPVELGIMSPEIRRILETANFQRMFTFTGG